jgi:hypothetical protein
LLDLAELLGFYRLVEHTLELAVVVAAKLDILVIIPEAVELADILVRAAMVELQTIHQELQEVAAAAAAHILLVADVFKVVVVLDYLD